MPSVALLTISDGRTEYHQACYRSAMLNLPLFDQYIKVDDTDHSLGFSGAVQNGWSQVTTDYLFHLEADFTFSDRVNVQRMVEVLEENPYLVQIALLRQPWNKEEKAAGGIMEMHPKDYSRRCDRDGSVWFEHTRNVTTNPSLWPRWVIDRGWPQVEHSEGHFGIDLFASDPTLRSAYWGESPVVHIGTERTGGGY